MWGPEGQVGREQVRVSPAFVPKAILQGNVGVGEGQEAVTEKIQVPTDLSQDLPGAFIAIAST